MKLDGVEIDFLGHSGFLIVDGGVKRIAIDPYNISDNIPKVDIVLITHSHYDHCSIKDIQKIVKEGGVIVVPADAQSKITKLDNVNMQIIEVGDELVFGNIKIQAVPAYCIEKEFHPKKDGGLGYLIKIKGVVVYHAGDTDHIPEMKNLTGYGKHDTQFIVLLPISGKYTMDAEEAAAAAALMNPNLAIPMHYGAGVAGTIEDAKRFVELCEAKGVRAMILDKI